MKKRIKVGVSFEELRPFLLPVFLFSLMLLSFIYFILPKIKEAQEFGSDLEGKEERLSILTEKLYALENLSERELLTDSQTVLRVLPEEKSPLLAITAIKKAATVKGVDLEEIAAEPGKLNEEEKATAKSDPVPSLVLGVKIKGNLRELADFFGELESSLPLLRVSEVNLSRYSDEGIFSVNFEVLSFYASMPKSLGGISTPLPVLTEREVEVREKLRGFNVSTVADPDFSGMEEGETNPFL